MIVEKKVVSPQELKDFIQSGPLVTEIELWSENSIERFRMVSRDDRVIVVSISTLYELVDVEDDEEAE